MSKNKIAEKIVVENEELASKNMGIQGELTRRPLISAIIIFFNEERTRVSIWRLKLIPAQSRVFSGVIVNGNRL